MEAIRIRKAGFALRMPHKEFVDRYRLVIGTRKASSCLKGLDPTSAAQALVGGYACVHARGGRIKEVDV